MTDKNYPLWPDQVKAEQDKANRQPSEQYLRTGRMVPEGMLGRAYRPTFIAILVVVVIVVAAIGFLK